MIIGCRLGTGVEGWAAERLEPLMILYVLIENIGPSRSAAVIMSHVINTITY